MKRIVEQVDQQNIGDNLNRLTMTAQAPIVVRLRGTEYRFIRFDGPQVTLVDPKGDWLRDFLTDEEYTSLVMQLLSLEVY